MKYEIKGNTCFRGDEPAAIVMPDGSLEPVEGMERYRTACVKILAASGRRNADGTFVFVDDPAAAPPDTTPDAPADRPVIDTVRQLVRAVEAATGDTAPPMSPVWGDETPEIWSYLRRHVAAVNTIAANCELKLAHNHLED